MFVKPVFLRVSKQYQPHSTFEPPVIRPRMSFPYAPKPIHLKMCLWIGLSSQHKARKQAFKMLHTIAQIKLWSSNDCMGPHARIKMRQPLVVH